MTWRLVLSIIPYKMNQYDERITMYRNNICYQIGNKLAHTLAYWSIHSKFDTNFASNSHIAKIYCIYSLCFRKFVVKADVNLSLTHSLSASFSHFFTTIEIYFDWKRNMILAYIWYPSVSQVELEFIHQYWNSETNNLKKYLFNDKELILTTRAV
jgi:hypothetical protein